jgi:Holliday junction resolvase RusA-like endonuclease
VTLPLEHWQLPAVKVPGTPAPKGSMIPGRKRGDCPVCHLNGPLYVREDNKATKPWRKTVCDAGLLLKRRAGGTILGPVGIDVTLTVARPATATRQWPHVRGSNDVDKLARTVLDGLQDSGLIADDAQVVELVARKCYPDSPCPDRLDRPGAVIRIYPIGE